MSASGASYVDSSSLLKLLWDEPESGHVRAAVAAERTVIVSALTELEVEVQLRARMLGGSTTKTRYRAYRSRLAGFRDLDGFEKAAEAGRQLGCTGAFCIHPDQVVILNRVFSPSAAKIEHARRVIEAFEEGLRNGRASVTLDDRMVDTPVYKQAKLALERAEAVAAVERRKTDAMSLL